MRRLALEAREVAAALKRAGGSVEYGWVPRAENKDADALSNAGMDGRTIDRMLDDLQTGGTGAGVEAADGRQVGDDRTVEEQAVVEEVIDPAPPAVEPGPEQGPAARVVLVRHGVTDFTTAARLDGRGGSDPSLNATGRQQAAAAGRALAHLLGGSDARLVTSSLTRARETGAAVGRAIGATPVVDAAWDEQDFGDWDGASVHDLARERPDELDRLRQDATYARPGGETHAELAERVLAAYSRVVAAGGTTVVVCHRKPIMVVLADVLGIPHDRVWRLAAAPGSLNALEVWHDGTVSVVFTNRT
jgi:ribonuclease H / adenosylcobalamin/alpha-ribazole phosphatase